MPKFLDEKGIQHLWKKLSLEDYPNNETLVAVLNAIDDTKADKSELSTLIGNTPVAEQIKEAKAYTDTAITNLINSAPETLDTINELAAALGDDANFATTVTTQIGQKANASDVTTLTTRVEAVESKVGETSVDEQISEAIGAIPKDTFVIHVSIEMDDEGNEIYVMEEAYEDILNAFNNDSVLVTRLYQREYNFDSYNSRIGAFIFKSCSENLLSRLCISPSEITFTTINYDIDLSNLTYENLTTEDKTITGSINELNSNFEKYYLKEEANTLHSDLKSYVDTEVATLVNSAPETLDTIGELATAFEENKEVLEVLNASVATKANQSDLNTLNNTVASHTTSINALKTETWTFTLSNGSTVSKQVVIK